MRIFVNEFSGHPFQMQLSREFARRGHQVLHAYFAGNTSTPKGAISKTGESLPNLKITGLNIQGNFVKHSPLKRRAADIAYGKVVAEAVRQFKPDAVLSSNMPPDGQKILLQEARQHNAKFVYWLQDVYGLAVRFFFQKRTRFLAEIGGSYYDLLEKKLLHQSDAVVCISDGFVDHISKWKIDQRKIHVIENWAPLDEIFPVEKNNAWARENGVSEKFCFMYSGTLGMKHRPELLLSLAQHLEKTREGALIVNGAGIGAEWLRERTKDISPGVFRLQPFQPYERLSEVMGSADVLITLLDADAGKFAVPSKSLAYLCAGRAILMAAPRENLTTRILEKANAGLAVQPDATEEFVAAASRMVENAEERRHFGNHARAYAESNFDIGPIADRFLNLLERKPVFTISQPARGPVARPA